MTSKFGVTLRRALRGASAVSVAALSLLAAERNYDEIQLFLATMSGDIEQVDKAVRENGAECRHPGGWTPLMTAAVNCRPAVLDLLIRRGARVATPDLYNGAEVDDVRRRAREDHFSDRLNPHAPYRGWTALHYAALVDCEPCVRALLAAGADPATADERGKKPLGLARVGSPVAGQLARASAREREPLEMRLSRRVLGQGAAVKAAACALRRRAAGWRGGERPLVMLFVGGSGVGKTELAKTIASELHGADGRGFVRLDMSEYQERHEAAKLIGAPPGYVGHEAGGQLTRALSERPDALVLLDEVDKAHPDVLTVLLQLFDEGRLTDGRGKLVECKEAIFVMTCNLGAEEIREYVVRRRPPVNDVDIGGDDELDPDDGLETIEEDEIELPDQFVDEALRPILKREFRRDELLGRIDEVVWFVPLSPGVRRALVSRELQAVRSRAAQRGVRLRWTRGVARALAAGGWGGAGGARDLRGAVWRGAGGALAAAEARGHLPEGSAATLRMRSGRLTLHVDTGDGSHEVDSTSI